MILPSSHSPEHAGSRNEGGSERTSEGRTLVSRPVELETASRLMVSLKPGDVEDKCRLTEYKNDRGMATATFLNLFVAMP